MGESKRTLAGPLQQLGSRRVKEMGREGWRKESESQGVTTSCAATRLITASKVAGCADRACVMVYALGKKAAAPPPLPSHFHSSRVSNTSGGLLVIIPSEPHTGSSWLPSTIFHTSSHTYGYTGGRHPKGSLPACAPSTGPQLQPSPLACGGHVARLQPSDVALRSVEGKAPCHLPHRAQDHAAAGRRCP